jgi:hypothetical protein
MVNEIGRSLTSNLSTLSHLLNYIINVDAGVLRYVLLMALGSA